MNSKIIKATVGVTMPLTMLAAVLTFIHGPLHIAFVLGVSFLAQTAFYLTFDGRFSNWFIGALGAIVIGLTGSENGPGDSPWLDDGAAFLVWSITIIDLLAVVYLSYSRDGSTINPDSVLGTTPFDFVPMLFLSLMTHTSSWVVLFFVFHFTRLVVRWAKQIEEDSSCNTYIVSEGSQVSA